MCWCTGREFLPLVDAVEGAVALECTACCMRMFIADSEELREDVHLDWAACPCVWGGEAAVASALADDGSVRKVTVGLRCLEDGIVGARPIGRSAVPPTR